MLEYLAWLVLATGTFSPASAEEHMNYACTYTGGVCPTVPPDVLAVPLKKGRWGMHFRGTQTIFLNDDCRFGNIDPQFCSAILVHEMVHYIVSEQSRFVNINCANEQLAWSAYNSYVMEMGRFDLINLEWRRAYPRCQSR